MTTNHLILELAFERGYRGCTFATQDELRTPGYVGAWQRGRAARVADDRYRFGGPNYDHASTPDGV